MSDGLTPAMTARIRALTETVSKAVSNGHLNYTDFRLDLASLVQLVLAEARNAAHDQGGRYE